MVVHMAVHTRRAHLRNGRKVAATTVRTRGTNAAYRPHPATVAALVEQSEQTVSAMAERAATAPQTHWAPVYDITTDEAGRGTREDLTGCDMEVRAYGTQVVDESGDGYFEQKYYEVDGYEVILCRGRCTNTRTNSNGTVTYTIETEHDGVIDWTPDNIDLDRLDRDLSFSVGSFELEGVSFRASVHPDDAAELWTTAQGHVPHAEFLSYTPEPDGRGGPDWDEFDARRANRIHSGRRR